MEKSILYSNQIEKLKSACENCIQNYSLRDDVMKIYINITNNFRIKLNIGAIRMKINKNP